MLVYTDGVGLGAVNAKRIWLALTALTALGAAGAFYGFTASHPERRIASQGVAAPSGTSPFPSSSSSSRNYDYEADGYLNNAAVEVCNGITAAIQDDASYSGIQIVSAGIIVYGVGPATPHMRAVLTDRKTLAAGAGYMSSDRGPVPPDHLVPVSYVQAQYTAKQLQATVTRISHDWAALQKRGIDLVSVGAEQGTGVTVGVSDLTPQITAYLQTTYASYIHTTQETVTN